MPGETPVNVSFGVAEGRDRHLAVSFTAMAGGKTLTGRVVFEILEANSRQWNGSAILLTSRVEVD
jgi:hypothetical protein